MSCPEKLTRVGVDQEPDRLVCDLRDRRHEFVGKRCELRVHQKHPVETGQHADSPALTLQRVTLIGNNFRPIAEILRSNSTYESVDVTKYSARVAFLTR